MIGFTAGWYRKEADWSSRSQNINEEKANKEKRIKMENNTSSDTGIHGPTDYQKQRKVNL